jgi:thymidylate synthase (FAD)
MDIKLKSTIDVEYVDHMGSDRRCVEAMLVSTAGLGAEEAAEGAVEGRLRYLIQSRHGTPFECGALTVRVHAPIMVWREWHRHRVGFSYNEESARYKDMEPVFWLPPMSRPMMRRDGFKSARPEFAEPTREEYVALNDALARGYHAAYARYREMVDAGVDRGLARDVLGVGLFSACYVTANPRSIMHFLELRTKEPAAKRPSYPLWEIDLAARKLEAIFAEHWPITHRLWDENGRQAP